MGIVPRVSSLVPFVVIGGGAPEMGDQRGGGGGGGDGDTPNHSFSTWRLSERSLISQSP